MMGELSVIGANWVLPLAIVDNLLLQNEDYGLIGDQESFLQFIPKNLDIFHIRKVGDISRLNPLRIQECMVTLLTFHFLCSLENIVESGSFFSPLRNPILFLEVTIMVNYLLQILKLVSSILNGTNCEVGLSMTYIMFSFFSLIFVKICA